MMSDKTTLRERMFSMIEDWKVSGISQSKYCSTHSIAYHQFHYWYKRYKITKSSSSPNPPSFIRIQPTPPEAEDKSYAEIIYASGTKLIFHQVVDGPLLKSLVR